MSAQNPSYSSVNGVLLDKSQTTLWQFPEGLGGSYTIPASVKIIAMQAFSDNTNLISVTLPKGVTTIEESAFSGCSGLTSIAIPGSVTNIGYSSFSGCSGLTSITIPGSVTNIGDGAFAECFSLTNVCFEGDRPNDGGWVFEYDQVTVIHYAPGAEGWGSSFDGIPTAPCAQCGARLPDLVATSLEWNTNEGESGIDFAYSLQGILLTNATDAALYWANGSKAANILSSTPIYEEPIPADFEVGTTNEVSVEASDLSNPPSGATYILLVLDPDHLIAESDTNNNTLALSFAPPRISTQPADLSIVQGRMAVFTVEADGAEPLSYQWRFNGSDIEDSDFGHISGATEAELTISDVTTNDDGSYSVVISNDEGSATSTDATLTVLIPAQITAQPFNRVVIQGRNIMFLVAVTGTEPLNYQWQFNGTDLADDEEGHITGATNDTLEINEVQTNEAGSYSVIVSNEAATNNSDAATLTVVGMQGMVQESEYNALLDFYTATEGAGWKENGGWLHPLLSEWYGLEVTNLQYDALDNFILYSGNVSEINLETNGLAGDIPSSLANFTNLITLDLSGNKLQGSIPGSTFTFLNHLETLDLSSNQLTGVIPTGFGNLAIDLKTLDLSANDLSGSLPFDMANMAALEMLNLSHNNLSNAIALHGFSRLTTLDLSANAFVGNLTNIGIFPKLRYIDLSGNSLSNAIPINSGWFLGLCESTLQHLDLSDNQLDGTLPDLGQYTQLEELDLSDNQLTGSILADFNNLTLLKTLNLSRNNLTGGIPDFGGLTQLEELELASNNFSGSISSSLLAQHQLQSLDLSSNHFTGAIFEFQPSLQSLDIRSNDLDFTTATLGGENNTSVQSMLNEGIKLRWLSQNGPSITADPQNESIPNGGADPFSVTAQGAPPFAFQWQLNGTNLSDNTRIDGSTNSILSINPVEMADQGSYQVIVTNAYGSITSDFAMLTVTPVGVAPQITSHPASHSINVGQSASFAVTATGSTPLHYQWFLNGTKMPGATTTTVAITNAASSNAGRYSVHVTNAYGTASNVAGILTVSNIPPSFATNGAGLQLTNGMVLLQVNGLTGVGSAEIQASIDLQGWTAISTNAATTGTIQVIDTTASNAPQRYYRVVVSP